MNHLKDTRAYTKKANELVASHKTIILRTSLKNGNIIERVITPTINPVNKNYTLYTDVKKIYTIKNKARSIEEFSIIPPSELIGVEKIKLPSITSKDGVINTFIERLLLAGYVVYEG